MLLDPIEVLTAYSAVYRSLIEPEDIKTIKKRKLSETPEALKQKQFIQQLFEFNGVWIRDGGINPSLDLNALETVYSAFRGSLRKFLASSKIWNDRKLAYILDRRILSLGRNLRRVVLGEQLSGIRPFDFFDWWNLLIMLDIADPVERYPFPSYVYCDGIRIKSEQYECWHSKYISAKSVFDASADSFFNIQYTEPDPPVLEVLNAYCKKHYPALAPLLK